MGLLGVNSVLQINTGSYGSPAWSTCDFVRNLTAKPSSQKAEANTRKSRVNKNVKTNFDLTFTGDMLAEESALYTTFIEGGIAPDAKFDFRILNGPPGEPGTRGWRFDGQIGLSEEPQDRDGVEYPSFEVFVTPSANPVLAMKVTGTIGSPVAQYAEVKGATLSWS
jgi:hypothetical protein